MAISMVDDAAPQPSCMQSDRLPEVQELKLSEAIRLGQVASYQVLCLDIRDPELHAALTSTSEGAGSVAVRGARLAAVQTGLMRATVEERFRRVLFFHSRIGEAEAMAAGGPAIATRLAEDDPDTFPPAERVWADWLYGEHPPLRRRQVLDEFASGFLGGDGFEGRDIPAALRVLSSVRDLGEGAHWRRTLRMPIRPLGRILPAYQLDPSNNILEYPQAFCSQRGLREPFTILGDTLACDSCLSGPVMSWRQMSTGYPPTYPPH